MAIQELLFQKEAEDSYIATFISTGNCVIELDREKHGEVVVSAAIPGMPAGLVKSFEKPWSPVFIFQLDIMSGMEVTVVSRSEVLSAKMATSDLEANAGDVGSLG